MIAKTITTADKAHFSKMHDGRTKKEETWFKEERRLVAERGRLRLLRLPRPPGHWDQHDYQIWHIAKYLKAAE